MKAKWLLERDTFEDNLDNLVEAIKTHGLEYEFTYDYPSELVPKSSFQDEDCVICYGSLGMIQKIRRHRPWLPGVYCDLSALRCTNYFQHFAEYLLNDRYILLPFYDVKRQKDFIFNTVFPLNIEGAVFMRPNSAYKLFAGTLVHEEKFDYDYKYMSFYDFDRTELVIISSPKKIESEWRLVVVGEEVISSSQYKENGLVKLREGCPSEVLEFGNKLAKIWQPEPAFVMDVCRTPSGELKLLELNSFSCSGLYLCDKMAVVEGVSQIALKEWQDYHVV